MASLPEWLNPAHRKLALLLALLMLAGALTEGIGLLLLVPMLALVGGNGGAGRIPAALQTIGIELSLAPLLTLFVGLVILRALIGLARTLAAHRFEISVVDGLRARAWDALLNCQWRVLSTMRQSDNASLLISNIDRVGLGLSQAISALAAAATLAALGLAALAISVPATLAAAAGGLLILALYRRMRRRAAQLGTQLGEAHRGVFGTFGESLGALRIIKSFGAEARTIQANMTAQSGLRRTQYAFLRESGLAQAALQGGGAIVLALLSWLAITRWGAGPEQVIPLAALFARATPLLSALQLHWQHWAHARPALDEAMELIQRAEAAGEIGTGAQVPPPPFTQDITLQDVSVQFPGRDTPVLSAINLSIPRNSALWITGPSGAGKSTLADLLGGLLSPDEGHMLVDGAALTAATRRAWRRRVAYVQQQAVLFNASVRDNLLWARPDADEGALRLALEKAAAQFVFALPQGLDSPLGDGGKWLSGGERQRIALARALLTNPDVLILDEATSALDAESEQVVIQALSDLKGQLTIVIIGHRGALSQLADVHVTVELGTIAHVTLMKNS